VSFPFDPRQGLVIVWAELFGPSGRVPLRLALDTGATSTLLNTIHLVAVGCDPSPVSDRVQVTTGSGMEYVPRIQVSRFKVLGQERAHFPVLSHTLPPSSGIDGLLGLDFLRGQRLEIDFCSASGKSLK
jgi:predicted aspartyl protease